jgi:hypothetical protein
MKKTTKMNDGMNIMGREVLRTEPSLCAKRKAARREAERVLRGKLRITHQHPLDRNGANKDVKTVEAWKEYDAAIARIE